VPEVGHALRRGRSDAARLEEEQVLVQRFDD
jgi:hypothetical protein